VRQWRSLWRHSHAVCLYAGMDRRNLWSALSTGQTVALSIGYIVSSWSQLDTSLCTINDFILNRRSSVIYLLTYLLTYVDESHVMSCYVKSAATFSKLLYSKYTNSRCALRNDIIASIIPCLLSHWQGWKTPKRTPCWLLLYMCSGSVLLGDLVGVSRSRECDLLSVLLIYPRIFLDVFIVYRLLVGYLFVLFYMLMCVSCFG